MTQKIKVALLDFDGTLVTKDILDILCRAVGKEKESEDLNVAFHQGKLQGLETLIKRINFLKGITKTQIKEILDQNTFLMPGVKEFLSFLKENKIITILASGNILPVLEYYKELLSLDYIIGSKPTMQGDVILGIGDSAFSSKNFKIDGIQSILKNLNIDKTQIIALGDSPSDKGMFGLSNYAIAVNPKGDIAHFANKTIGNDLEDAIALIKEIV